MLQLNGEKGTRNKNVKVIYIIKDEKATLRRGIHTGGWSQRAAHGSRWWSPVGIENGCRDSFG